MSHIKHPKPANLSACGLSITGIKPDRNILLFNAQPEPQVTTETSSSNNGCTRRELDSSDPSPLTIELDQLK